MMAGSTSWLLHADAGEHHVGHRNGFPTRILERERNRAADQRGLAVRPAPLILLMFSAYNASSLQRLPRTKRPRPKDAVYALSYAARRRRLSSITRSSFRTAIDE